ncbi:MAG TPA: glycosyltransferase, partial [Chthoniobacterales bacterium]|nr:glycosyltransferase [Chthoniobacterales bacterium]
SDRIDVFWAGRTLHPRLDGGVRTVCTVHDLNHLVVPETMRFQSRWSDRLWFRGDILSADRVLANSRGTAERIRTMVGAEVCDVVLPGVRPRFYLSQPVGEIELRENLSRLGVERPYLLSVATSEPRKNLDAVIDAFIELKKDGKLSDYQLVLAGPTGWKNRALKQRVEEARKYGLVLVGYVPDESMPILYAGADALVFPSLYEGFGMPVLEARSCGARVVTTDIPELREAGDEYVVYVQPTLDGIKEGILRAISLPKPPPAAGRPWKESAQILARALRDGQDSQLNSMGKTDKRELRTRITRTQLLLDCSLSLINRTGAHYISEDLALAFGGKAILRRWRLLRRQLPGGIARKIFGRLMLREIALLGTSDRFLWPEPKAVKLKRLFLDPLYVKRSRLESSDIVLCHDIGPISHPELYDNGTIGAYKKAYAKIAMARPGMVFVSNTSRLAFEAQFGTDFRFLKAIPLYVRTGALAGHSEPISGIEPPFFLTVGALETRKNQRRVIEAFGQYGFAKRGVSYVLCGARGTGSEEVMAAAAGTPGVKVLGYVSDAQLRWLYQEASAFVLPSLLEGFGMPALEAALHGLIPIISRNSALSEAVNGLAIQVDPHSVSDIGEAMKSVLALDEGKRDQLRNALVTHAHSATREKFLAEWADLISSELH